MSSGPYVRFLKPAVDRGFAALVLLLLSPLLALVALVVRLESTGPVFYRQTRIGLSEQRFDILKFRTMVVDPERGTGQTLAHSDGVTRGGRFFRRLKIDEVPQLINVLRGDMSLVGPRPCLPTLLDTIEPWARERFSVRPGLTGLAQVNGNIHLSWPERWQYDTRYARAVTFLTDAKIIARTLLVVAFGEQRFRRAPPR